MDEKASVLSTTHYTTAPHESLWTLTRSDRHHIITCLTYRCLVDLNTCMCYVLLTEPHTCVTKCIPIRVFSSSEADRSVPDVALGELLTVADDTKPVIHDVRLLKKSPLQLNAVSRPLGRTLTGLDLPNRTSSTALDCLSSETPRRRSRLSRTASTFGHVTQ